MMSTDETYDDRNDDSILRVWARDYHRGLLRFTGNDTVDQTDVDLDRASVRALVAQATKWLEDTEVRLPTVAGSVVRANNPTPAFVMLQHGGEWVGASGQPVDPDLWADGWTVVHDAATMTY